MICRYRIYPRWFGGGHVTRPMNELADHDAKAMGRTVASIDIADYAHDHRGSYIDFTVTYTSTTALRQAEPPTQGA